MGTGYIYSPANMPTGGLNGAYNSSNVEGLASINLGGGYYAVQYMSSVGGIGSNAGTFTDIYLKVFNYSTGNTQVGTLVTANTVTDRWQIGSQMVALKEGGFVSVWASNAGSTGTNGTMDGFDVYARRFAWNGTNIVAVDVAENRVNTSVTGTNGVGFDRMSVQLGAAALEQGGYVVVWSKFLSATSSEIFAQTYDAAGNRLGGETLISTDTAPVGVMPAVSALEDGGYVVSWTSFTSGNWYDNSDTANVKSVVVNADGSIRGAGDSTVYPITASYLDAVSGIITGDGAVNTLDGRHGATVLNAGAGNDYIMIKDTNFTSADGGADTDTLIWSSTANLNYADIVAKTTGIEIIHLGDLNANVLSLSVNDVLAASGTTDTLVVQGGTTDSVNLDGTWSLLNTVAWHGASYSVYSNQLSKTASLWVQQGLTVNIDQTTMPGTSGSDVLVDSAADNTIEGKAGNDSIYLTASGHDTLLFKLLNSADATGGNGVDQVNGFTVGNFSNATVPSADRLNFAALLPGGVTAGNAADYIKFTTDDVGTHVAIDRDGTGTTYSATEIVTLNGVNTDLPALLALNQLVLV